MVSWKDLGGGLAAAPRAALRLEYWLAVLLRLLFSHVFLGHALVAALAYFVGRSLLAGVEGKQWLGVGLMALVFAPALLLPLCTLLLPYGLWVFTPAAVRVLPRHLALPPPGAAEQQTFSDYVVATLPVLGLAILLGVGYAALPGLNRGELLRAYFVLAGVLYAYATLGLFVRTALAEYYAEDDVRRFMAATRWWRLLVWLPFSYAASWGASAAVFATAKAFGVSEFWFLTPTAPPSLAILGAHALLSILLGIAYIGALLLACGRIATPPKEKESSIHSQTEVMVDAAGRPRRAAPSRRPAPARRPLPPWARWGAALLVLLALPAGAWLGRAQLTDWYFQRDAAYASAAQEVTRRFGHGGRSYSFMLDAGDAAHRLRGGYIVYACSGQVDRANWIAQRLDVLTGSEPDAVLACAACSGNRQAVDRILQAAPRLNANVAMKDARAPARDRTALACAVEAKNVLLADRLLKAGAIGGYYNSADSALQQAIALRHWPMVKLIASYAKDTRREAVRTALALAAESDPRAPVEILPRLLEAGLPLGPADYHGRNLFHWAARRHDLALAKLLLTYDQPPELGPAHADAEGALPWMHVLRKAELEGKPLGPEALELLQLLLPQQADVNVATRMMTPQVAAQFPVGWTAGAATLNQPAARALLGPALDFGLLPQDPGTWWKFSSFAEAEAFIRSATPEQLQRAENPQSAGTHAPQKLSNALVQAGWAPLADQLLAATAPKPAVNPKRR